MTDDSWADVADLHSTSLDEPSLFEKAADFVTKGIPLAAASGVTSVLNTGISFGNLFGDFQQIDFSQKVQEFDNDLSEYYKQHETGIDLGGFIGTSLIPGTLGMKGLKALQTLKDGEGIGANVGAVAGYFAAKQDKYIKAAAETLGSPGQTLLAGINKDKVLAIAAGFGEQALQGAAFETGVLLTMNQNPVMEPQDRDNYVSALWNHAGQSLKNAALFSAIGGTIGGAITAGTINKQIATQAEKDFPTLYAYRLGGSNLPNGTTLAGDVETLQDLKATLKQMESIQGATQPGAEALVTERALVNQRETIKNFEAELGTFITTKFTNQAHPEIGKYLWEAIQKVAPTVENGYPIPVEELVARAFGGAEKVSRIGEGVSDYSFLQSRLRNPDESLKTFYHGTVEDFQEFKTSGLGAHFTSDPAVAGEFTKTLDSTKAGSIQAVNLNIRNPLRIIDNGGSHTNSVSVARDLIAAGVLPKDYINDAFYIEALTGNFQETSIKQIEKMKEILQKKGYDGIVYKNTGEGGGDAYIAFNPNQIKSKFTSEITHNPYLPGKTSRLINLANGEITSQAFPRAADLGIVEVKNGKMYVGGEYNKLPETFDPVVNIPRDSNSQFLMEQSKPFISSKITQEISVENIPALEAAVVRGDTNVNVVGYRGLATDLGEILKETKNDAIIELTNLGKGWDYISTALNVPKEYLESGQGSVILGTFAEDNPYNFLRPLYAEIHYTGAKEMNRFMAQGLQRVHEKEQLALAARKNAAVAIFGDAFVNFPEATGQLKGVGYRSGAAGFFSFTDAARGSTMMTAMQSGKLIDKLAKEQATNWQNALYSLRQEITTDAAALYKRNINAMILRASAEDMVRVPEELFPGGITDSLILMPRGLLKAGMKDKDPTQWLMNTLANKNIQTQLINEPLASAEARYLIARQQLTSEQASKWNLADKARGVTREQRSTDAFYEPPIDTTRQPYFALVSEKNPLADLRPQSMIVAQSAEELARKVGEVKAKFGDILDVYTKSEIKANKQLEATYDSGMLFGKTAVDSALHKEGKLFDFIPRKDAYIFEEENAWIWKQAQAINRQGVELTYGQEMAQLRFLRNNWNQLYSRFGQIDEKLLAQNPYNQVLNTFLNISNKSNYDAFWGKLNEGTQAAWNYATDAWTHGYRDATEGKLSFQEAEKIAQQAGFSAPFGKVAEDVFRESFKDPNSLSKIVAKVNMAASTLMIRMDALNSLINVISLPVLLSSETAAVRKSIVDQLGLSVTVPGTSHQIPSTMSLISQAIKGYWKKDTVQFGSETLAKKDWFLDIGAIRTNPQQIQDSLAIPLDAVKRGESGLLDYSANLARRIGDAGSRYTGNDLAEELVRYIAADAGLKLGQAQGITNRGDLAAYVNLIVNRVHGNYLASQRPTVFSGPVGQAISLFQTYQFNMIQQMTRYLQEGNYRSVAVAAAMQNTIFGLQGNPLFWQLNKYIGDSNREHGDLVTGIADVVGTDAAKWLLYGLGANSLQTNLYNRGDLTPRFTTILPTSLQDIPAVSITTKAIGSFLDSMKAVANGAPVADSILQGVAHAGFNRPLSGLATLVSGKKTTGSGTLLAAYNDIDTMLVAAKIAGGEPLNNAVAFDSYYRLQQYKTDETQRLQDLGTAVKLTATGKGGIDPDKMQEFMNRYAAEGGDLKSFQRFLIHNTKNANQSVVNQMKAQLRSPLTQKQMSWLGAEGPQDYAAVEAQ